MVQGNKGRWAVRLARPTLAVALLAGTSAWGQVVTNPGFETGTLPPWSATYAGGSSNSSVSASQGSVTPHSGSYLGWGYDNDGTGRLSQNISTVAGATYSLSVWVAQSNPNAANAASIRLGAANTPVSCALGAAGVWTQCTGSFTVAGTSERLDLQFATVAGSGAIAFDDVTVTQTAAPAAAVQPVPTLSEWTLLAVAAAAGGLGMRRLRRRA